MAAKVITCPAEAYFETLSNQIENFQLYCQENDDVVATLASTSGIAIDIESLGWAKPESIVVRGHDAQGNPMRVVTHYSATTLILRRFPAKDPEQPRRIGFLSGGAGAPPLETNLEAEGGH